MKCFFFRWNSKYLLLDSHFRLKPSIVQTLSNIESDPVEFSNADWKLIEKVLLVLKPFQDATKTLSYHDASISLVIPIITGIMKSLDVTSDDHGVRGMKRALVENMGRRFVGVEDDDNCAIATLLDCKYKKYFYRDSGTFERVKEVLIDLLVEELRSEEDSQVI